MRSINHYAPSIVVAIVAVAVFLAGPAMIRDLAWVRTQTRIVQASERLAENDILERLNQAMRDIATIVEPSVVHISTYRTSREDRFGNEIVPHPAVASGSGWVYDMDGHIITNYHVVEDAATIQVQLYNGRIYEADTVGIDPARDIAVLKIDASGLFPATRAPADEPLQQGDRVFAFGSPFDYRFSMSSGVISGLGRTGNLGIVLQDFIQVDAAINPGNSGGPLTDVRGRVIGMNTAIATNRPVPGAPNREGQFSGIGLAIPIYMIESSVSQILRTGEVSLGYIGVHIDALSSAQAQALNFTGRGILISRLIPDGPAENAGLQVGDIVTHVDGMAIESVSQLQTRIAGREPQSTINIQIWRYDAENDGRDLTYSVVLAERDDVRNVLTQIMERRGIRRITTATPERAERFGVEFIEGALIEQVGSSIGIGGLHGVEPGSIVTHVGGQPIRNVDEFFAQLRQVHLNMSVQIEIVLPGGERITRHLRF